MEIQFIKILLVRERTNFCFKNKYNCNLIICLSHLGLKYNSDKISDYILAKEQILLLEDTPTLSEKPIEFSNYGNKKTYISQVGWAGLS